jgi:predicted transcriptional regulator
METNLRTISWIFLSIALASESSPADSREISEIADGINHAVPSYNEIHDSISWLIKRNLILKIETTYSLSDLGHNIFRDTQAKTSKIILNIWQNLELELQKYNV